VEVVNQEAARKGFTVKQVRVAKSLLLVTFEPLPPDRRLLCLLLARDFARRGAPAPTLPGRVPTSPSPEETHPPPPADVPSGHWQRTRQEPLPARWATPEPDDGLPAYTTEQRLAMDGNFIARMLSCGYRQRLP
jgi:hypothetical protein